MSDPQDPLLDCSDREIESADADGYLPDYLKTPSKVLAVLAVVIAFFALVGTCGQ